MKINRIAISVALCFGVLETPVFAQEATPEENVEVINVTGSFIKGVDLEGSQPLTILDSETIRKSGANTLSELMLQINLTRGGTGSFSTSESGATSTSTPAGQAAASLRGMGPSSTLTLINGRRIAASSFAAGTQNFVDINSIPLAAIDRVEILATGASAIYGADAVAGVINYILRDDFDGIELNVSFEDSTASHDESKKNFQLLWGTELADGNLTLFADYYDRNSFKATDRSYTRDPVLVNSYSYLPKGTPNIYFWSARDGNEIGSPDCNSDLVTTEFNEQICAYYGNEDDYLETPLESFSGGLTYTKDIGDLRWKTDFFASRTDSTSFSSPAPIDSIFDEEGPFTDETSLDIFPDEIRNSLLDAIFIDPFFDLTPAGRQLWGFRYDARFNDPRTIQIETTNMRLVSSLEGELGEWDWESAITLSHSKSDQEATAGIYNRFRYHAAIAGELCDDASIASYDANNDSLVCSNGGLPRPMYNPFLQNDATNEATLALAQERPTRDGESTVYGWDVRFNGELMALGDDFIRAAFGAEVRREEITDVPSINARARFENAYLVDVFGFGSSLSEADRTQFGAFAEFYIPFTEKLEVSLAGRFDDYNDFGSSFNPKLGVTYRPSDDLVLRGSWSTAFRAPSLTQAGVQLRTTTARFDCSQNQTVSDLFCDGQNDVRSQNVLELGNQALRAEESESLSLGLAWSPTDDTLLTVDYWSFEHDDLIDTDMTGVLARAISDASLRHCGLVPEGEQGISFDRDLCLVTDGAGLTIEDQGANLNQILDAWVEFDDPRFAELPLFRDHVLLLENTGTQDLNGIDFAIDHTFKFKKGFLDLGLEATHYLSFERNRPGSDEIEELAGTWRYPENVATASVFWENADETWFVGLTAFYTDAYEDDVERLRNRELDELDLLGELDENGQREVADWTIVMFSAGYDVTRNASLRLTIDNLFDKKPPRAYGSSRGFDSFNHDAYGTTYRISLSYFFE
jgi:outer membrane receptor protein involved in Fe transport